MPVKTLYLIDANAFCYRAFYAVRALSTSYGQPTGAIYGFLNILNKILKEKKPDYLGVCFDVSRQTFRQKKFAEYKINRPPMPDGLVSQIPLIKKIISAYGITICEKAGFEADDVIATLAVKAKAKGIPVVIVSSDKDILQLVSDGISVLSPHKEEDILYDEKKVTERFGVGPDKITDIIALMGDDTDNIPGARGIGEKTAVELIRTFGSVEELLRQAQNIKQEKTKKIVSESADIIRLSRELAVLDSNVDLDIEPDKLAVGSADTAELFKIFKQLEFKNLLKTVAQVEKETDEIVLQAVDDDALKALIKSAGELAIYGAKADELVFSVGDKIFSVARPGKNLKSMLAEPALKKTGYDLKKAAGSLAREGIALGGFYFDVMIAAHLVNPAKSDYTLTDITLDYLDRQVGAAISGGRALSLILELKPVLERQLREKKLEVLFSTLEMPLAEVLAEMEQVGVKLDLEALRELSRDIEKRLVKLIDAIYEASGEQFNINSPKQLREILFVKLKLPVGRRSKTGPSTDEEVLRGLADKHRLPALLLEYRQLTKLKNTYIDALPALVDESTGRLHTCFNQTATETGRLSSSNPNLQNIPVKTDIGRNIRRAIIASSADYRLLSCDYSQVELRILAHLSADEALISAFKSGEDIHRATAGLIYGIAEKDVDDLMRQTAKRVNFGIIYGQTSYGLSRDLGIPLDEAQIFIDAYFARYPRVKEYIEREINKAQKDGFVATLLGRRRYIPEINNKNQGLRQFAERQAVNTPIQGTAADLIKMAMIQIHGLLKDKSLRAKMVLQVHDELVFDLPLEELKQVAALARQSMENVLELKVPVRVDIKSGRNWLEMEEYK
ncbi:MAG: DNA polymerase I [Candidatus Omnitrophota bacterium]|nr:DNA polymerase I [Candidatus Omnitrophota bacterium]